MSERATLQPGQWFMHDLQWIPPTLSIYEGSRKSRTLVRKITRMQAIALTRWHGHPSLYFSYEDGNGRWKDVHVVGDIEAWTGELT